MPVTRKLLASLAIALSFVLSAQSPSIAGHTTKFKEKEGFEQNRKDIINTLKDNQVTQFQSLLDGLSLAFGLDKTLKGVGPFTIFAPSDRAFKHINDGDLQSLFSDKKKLRRVLEYHIVSGKLDSAALKSAMKVKTMEGHEVTINTHGTDMYAEKALVSTSDIPCSNGIIYVLDEVMWPPQ